jgi:hypothetical protein
VSSEGATKSKKERKKLMICLFLLFLYLFASFGPLACNIAALELFGAQTFFRRGSSRHTSVITSEC